jgi:hypothetical protein
MSDHVDCDAALAGLIKERAALLATLDRIREHVNAAQAHGGWLYWQLIANEIDPVPVPETTVATLSAAQRKTFTTLRGGTLSTCTLPDLEVLKAMEAVPEDELRLVSEIGTIAVGEACKAELARRGLK